MAIPESQLETWSKQGATSTSQTTYASIKHALDTSSCLEDKQFERYLQGSYANATNIRGDSDVDVVVELVSPFLANTERLSEEERRAFDRDHHDAEYKWADFRQDVEFTLRDYYGSSWVNSASRCLRVVGKSGRLDSDVVVAVQYRIYTRYRSRTDNDFIGGIKFKDLLTGAWIENFPKHHRQNGSAKNNYSRTKENYKPSIRMFKNARNRLIRDGELSEHTAPSYFVECLFYNVPDDRFEGTLQQIYLGSLKWLCEQFVASKSYFFLCQNEQLALFGTSSTQWNERDAQAFLKGLIELWKGFE